MLNLQTPSKTLIITLIFLIQDPAAEPAKEIPQPTSTVVDLFDLKRAYSKDSKVDDFSIIKYLFEYKIKELKKFRDSPRYKKVKNDYDDAVNAFKKCHDEISKKDVEMDKVLSLSFVAWMYSERARDSFEDAYRQGNSFRKKTYLADPVTIGGIITLLITVAGMFKAWYELKRVKYELKKTKLEYNKLIHDNGITVDDLSHGTSVSRLSPETSRK